MGKGEKTIEIILINSLTGHGWIMQYPCMAKNKQPYGRISTDLGAAKQVLEKAASEHNVSAHKMSRDLIVEGLRQMEAGELKYQSPSKGGFNL